MYREVTSTGQRVIIFVSIMSLALSFWRYVLIAEDMKAHVADQAEAHQVSTWHMLGSMFGKVLLYLILPAAILTLVLVGIALLVT